MNKAEIKKQPCISITRFLKSYVGITNERVIDLLANLSHKEFKVLCNDLCDVRLCSLPFEVISDELLQTSEVLLVADRGGHLAPYRNPEKQTDYYDVLNNQPIFTGPFYDSTVTRDEYIDYIESIAGDENAPKRQFRLVGTSTRTSREEW